MSWGDLIWRIFEGNLHIYKCIDQVWIYILFEIRMKYIIACWMIFCCDKAGVFPCVLHLQWMPCVQIHSRNPICLHSYSISGCLFILPCHLTSIITARRPLISTECVCVCVYSCPTETLAGYHLQLKPGDLSKAKNNLPPGSCWPWDQIYSAGGLSLAPDGA